MYFTRGFARKVKQNHDIDEDLYSSPEELEEAGWDESVSLKWAVVVNDFWNDHWKMQRDLDFDGHKLMALHPFLMSYWMVEPGDTIWCWLKDTEDIVKEDKFNWIFNSILHDPIRFICRFK